MKKLNVLLSLSFLAAFLSFACTKSDASSERTSFKITETNDLFEIEASYNGRKTSDIQRVLNSFANPQMVYKTQNDNIARTMTVNGVTFYLKAAQGSLYIKFVKNANAVDELQKMKTLSKQIGDVLK
jgi:hypothetical protein